MLTTTMSLLRGQVRRLAASSLAIVIGVAFVTATLVLSATLRSSLHEAIAGQATRSDVVVTSESGELTEAQLSRIRTAPEVRAAAAVREDYVDVDWPAGSSLSRISSLPGPDELRWQRLERGRWPRPGAREVAVDATTPEGKISLRLGGRVTLEPREGRPVTVTVVGIADVSGSPLAADLPTVLARSADVAAWTGSGIKQVNVLTASGVNAAELRGRVAAAVGDGEVTVRTGQEHAAALVDQASGETDALPAVLLAFAAVALFVAAVVVANTFTVLVAQRTRQLALLRCVGATRRQVFASVLAEAGFLGVVASAVGVAVGVGAGAAVTTAGASVTESTLPLTKLAVPAGAVVIPLVVGVATTIAAALVPARTATRVRPLAALRTITIPIGRRAGVIRTAAGTVLVAVGFAALGVGAAAGSYPLGILGGLISGSGVLLLARIALPAAARLLRRPLRIVGGVPGRLACENAVRNPGRASATGVALLVGVTLISTVLVATATAQATLDRQLDENYPVDLGVIAAGEPLDAEVTSQIARTPGVAAAAVLPGTTVRVNGRQGTVLGVGRAAAAVSRGDAADPGRGEVLLPRPVARNSEIRYGDTMRLTVGSRSIEVTVRPSPAEVSALLVTRADLRRLDPRPTPRVQWVRASSDADVSALLGRARQVIATNQPGAVLNGALRARDAYQGMIRTALLVALGLLAVSMIIAVIGIANTLSLSVIERTRESALLRALGLTRRQLRASLAWEAMLLAVVASVVGVVLGCVYGVAGGYSLLAAGAATVPAVPVGRLALVVATALLAGTLASVLPARRAARTPPASALAGE